MTIKDLTGVDGHNKMEELDPQQRPHFMEIARQKRKEKEEETV